MSKNLCKKSCLKAYIYFIFIFSRGQVFMPIIKTENGYIYKKTAKRTGFSKSLFVITLFLLSVCVVAGSFYAFSKFDLTSALNLNKYLVFQEKTYYAVSLCSADSFSSLAPMVDEVKYKNGAGFVMKSGEKYFLLASIYDSQSDAQKVLSQIESQTNEYDAQIVQIQFDRVIISSSFEINQVMMIKDALNLVNRSFESLFQIVNMLDRGEILPAEALSKLEVFAKTCREEKETFANAFQNISENIVTSVKIFQSEVVSDLSILSASNNLSADIKYTILDICQKFVSLQKKILK